MSRRFPSAHFGPNHAGVAEVFDFALSEACFGPMPPLGRLPPDVRIVRMPPDPNGTGNIEVEGESGGPFLWRDFLEHRRADYISPKRPTMGDEDRWEVSKRMDEVIGATEVHLYAKLAGWRRRWPRYFLDRLVVALLIDAAQSRAFVEPPVPFWESIFEALRAGAIPVGWAGRWPAGRMVVFLPPDPVGGGAK